MKLPILKIGLLLGVIAAIAIGFTVFATTNPANKAATTAVNEPFNNLAKAVITVDGMSCGGCVSTINAALESFEGIKDINVDVASGKTEVIYRTDKLTDVGKLVDAITASGYPAKVLKIITAQEMEKQRLYAESMAANAIATVGNIEISRADFEAELAHARSRYESLYGAAVFSDQRGIRLLGNLKAQITQRLIAEAIQLNEIKQANFSIDDATVEGRYQAYLDKQGLTKEAFAAALKENGYSIDYFMRKFRDRVLIESYLEQKIFNGLTNDSEKQKRYAEWFANARLLAEVDYYDKDLERQVALNSRSGGCGNSCSASQ